METFDELTKEIPPEERLPLNQFHHIYLGSPDAVITLNKLMQRQGANPVYSNLSTKLVHHINHVMQGAAVKGTASQLTELPSGFKVRELDDIIVGSPSLTVSQISPFKYLKIQYISMETWRVAHDPLRCNPNFYHAPRYDFVIYRGAQADEYHIGQLQFMFTCEHAGMTFPTAIVKPYDPVYLPRSKIDDALGFFRLRARPDNGDEDQYVLVHMGSFVRGVVAVQDGGLPADYTHEEPEFVSHAWEVELDAFWETFYRPTYMPPQHDDRLVADLVDGDMFLRMRSYFPFLTT